MDDDEIADARPGRGRVRRDRPRQRRRGHRTRHRRRRRRQGARAGRRRRGDREQGVRERRRPGHPKSTPTAKRDQPDKRERTTPVKFVRQSVGELRKVVYPTGQQLINYFVVVLVFVLFVIAYVSLLDLGFGAAIFRIFS